VVMGSNPIPSIVSSVRIPDIRNTENGKERRNPGQGPKVLLERSNPQSRNYMRDIYNRKKKLSDWIERVNIALNRSDRTEVLKFVGYMKDNVNSILWIVRCITALISMRKFMRKCARMRLIKDVAAYYDMIPNVTVWYFSLPFGSEMFVSMEGLHYLRVSLRGCFCAQKSVIENFRRKMYLPHGGEARLCVIKSLHGH
jgi:hypothetical protein